MFPSKLKIIIFSITTLLSVTALSCDEETSATPSTIGIPDECDEIGNQQEINGILMECKLYNHETGEIVEETGESNLLAKALEYEKYAYYNHWYEKQILPAMMDSEDSVIGIEHVEYFNQFGDSACWNGHFLFSQAMRYMVSGNQQALENVQNLVSGIYNRFKIAQDSSGLPGIAARGYGKKGDAIIAGEENPESGSYREGTGEWSNYFWVDNVSTDQISGMMLGLNAAWDAVDDSELRDIIREIVTGLCDALMDKDDPELILMLEMDVTDENTKSYYYELGDKWYLNYNPDFDENFCCHDRGMYTNSFFLMAYKMSGEQKYMDFYEDYLINTLHMEEDIEKWDCTCTLSCAPTYNSYFNNNISIIAMYNLCRLEQYHPDLQQRYKDVMIDNFWYRLQNDKNAWFSYLIAACTDNYEPAIEVGNEQLRLFPVGPRRVLGMDLRGTEYDTNPPTPLDVNMRQFNTNFIWQRGQDTIYVEPNPQYEYPGTDYLAIYWMARYYGFIEDDDNLSLKWVEAE